MSQSLVTPSEKNRIEFFDLAKGFCIFLVVIYHVSSLYEIELPASNIIKSIRLPLYFFLSGCFFKTYGGWLDFLKRKCNKLLLPFAFWFFFSLALACLFWCFGVKLFSYYNISVKAILGNFLQGVYPNSPIWFLLCLFWVNLIFYAIHLICERINEKYKLLAIGLFSILGGLVGVTLSSFGIRPPLYIDSAFTALPFFTFGYFLFRFTSIAKASKFDKWIPLMVILLFVALYFLAPFYSLRRNTNINYHTFVMVYLCGFMGALAIILLAKMFKKIPVVSYWGRYSIMILVSHCIVYSLLSFLVDIFDISVVAKFSINLVLTMAICTALIPFFKKCMPHVTAQKDIIPTGEKEKK